MKRTIVIVAPPDVTLLDVTGPWEVFCRAALYVSGMYRVIVASADANTTVRTKFGLGLTCHCSVEDLDGDVDTGILRGRRATTHWAAFDLLPYFGAKPIDARVVVDGNLVSAAGITAGIDGALQLAALVRNEQVAQEIQLDIQYAPEPPFDSGSPERAPRAVLETVGRRYAPLTDARRLTAQRIAGRLGLPAPMPATSRQE